MKRLLTLLLVLGVFCCPVFSQKKETYHVRTVVIDPGHGGAKPGAQGSRSQEKNITLAVAKKFGQLIEDNYPDVKVIYTRTTDVDISLAERARIANRNKADLFISIHANSHPTSTPTGVETFVMGLSESRANLEVAKKENADILLEADYKNNADYQGFDPNAPETYVMLTMFQNAFIDKSLNLAQAIQTQYKKNLNTINRGVKQAELYVLYKTTCPSVLTEIGFISNLTEEAYMLSEEGQAIIAISLFDAFMTYKSTEEGSNRIAKPVIKIKGYHELDEVAAPEPKVVPEVVEAVSEVVEVVKETPKADTVAVAVAAPVAERQADTVVAAPVVPSTDAQGRPLPSAGLTRREVPASSTPTVSNEKPTSSLQPITLQPPVNTVAADARSFYTVQFFFSPTMLGEGAPQLEGMKNYECVPKGKGFGYVVGRFRTFQEAQNYCNDVRRFTRFKDAWPTQYKEESIVVEPAPAAAPTPAVKKSAAGQSQKGVVYRVQFCTASREMKVGDPDLGGIKDFRVAKSGKYYLYTAGNYTTLAQAEQRCAEIKKQGRFKDAFVVAFRNGRRVSLDEVGGKTK